MDTVIFDAWTSYGPRPGKDPAERWTLDHLREDLDFFGVAGALVRHEQANYYDAMHINRQLVREIHARREQLVPCWMALPHQAGDFPEPKELERAMIGENVKAICLRPARHAYPVHGDLLGPLADMLNARSTLILTTLPDLGTYDSAVRFCDLFHHCPVLIGEADWGNWRLMTAILDRCPNVRMEFHFFQANRAIEYICGRYGVERTLFGSGLLKHSAGAARGFIDWSLLDAPTLSRFAGGNLRRLLGEGPQTGPSVPRDADPIVVEARAGRALSVPVLDAHCHILDEGLNGAGAGYVMIRGDWPSMRELTHRMGVDVTAMMSWSGTVSMDVEAGNALIERVVQQAPDEVIGVSSCDPTHQTAAEIIATCRRLHLDRGFRGMKPYYTNRVSYADRLYDPYWEFGNAHRLYALLHAEPSLGGLDAVRDVAKRYPELTILIAHAGGSWEFARQAADVIREFPNTRAELTLTPVPNGIIEWLCQTVGPDRVLFGTDAPMRDPRPQLGWCVYTRLPLAEKKQVLGGNFATILRRGQLPGHSFPTVVEQSQTL